ncbi:MAG: hemolysin III family protein [Candidatus Onthovivens sp.]|nr:hemolysin III family protein [Candidatus Onthovivens sp.]
MSLKEIELPPYKLSHELWNSISHGLGAILGIISLIICLLKVINTGYDGYLPPSNQLSYESFVCKITSIIIYSLSLIITYTISCIYHALKKNNGKRVMRVIDHDTVYLLISGTYTPFCLVSLRHTSLYGVIPNCGYIIFALVWILVTIGIVFNSININKFKVLSFVMYICAGWTIIFAAKEVLDVTGFNGFMLLLFGGISYTLGSILYGLGGKYSVWFHTVFHFFVLAGSVLQFISIYLYVL